MRVGNISSAGGAGRGYCCACGPILCPANCASPNTINMAGDSREEEAGTGHGKIKANY